MFFDQLKPLLEPITAVKRHIEVMRLTEKFWQLRDRRTEKARKELGVTQMAKEIGREKYYLYNKRLLGYAERLVELKADTLKSDCILQEVMAIAMATTDVALGLKAVAILEKAGDAHLLGKIPCQNRTRAEVQKEALAAHSRLACSEIAG